MKPQRIQLSRRAGFRLQSASLALNGLPAVKVDRSTRWGNLYPVVHPYSLSLSMKLFANTASGFWNPGDFPPSWRDELVHRAYAAHQEWLKRLGAHPIEAIRRDLRGKNLACWCPPGQPCHADILLTLANSPDAVSDDSLER